jgi:hypothetical protein
VQLKDDAPVIAVEKGAMSDIKDNSFVGITAMAQPDGTIKAVEVHVFAEPLRGTGEGHYPWDLMPSSTMTNAAVTQQVKKVEGNTLTPKYKDGEKTIVVPSDAARAQLGAREQSRPKVRCHDLHRRSACAGIGHPALVPNSTLLCAAVRPSGRNGWPLALC